MPPSRVAATPHGCDRSPLPDSNRRPLPYHRRYIKGDERLGGSESRLTKPIPSAPRGMDRPNRVQGFLCGGARFGRAVFGLQGLGAGMGAAA